MLKPILVAGALLLLFLALGHVGPGGESWIAMRAMNAPIEATPAVIFAAAR